MFVYIYAFLFQIKNITVDIKGLKGTGNSVRMEYL